jgi:transcriptional regulator of acetoin/glycerol metabolism
MKTPEILDFAATSKSFSNDVMSAWENFMTYGNCRRGNVRNVIRTSWERCRNKDIPPNTVFAPLSVVGDELQQHQEYHRDLLEATNTVVVALKPILDRSRSMLVVTDPQGVVLDVYGAPRTLDQGTVAHIIPGAHWAEVHSGTNAIGTAIATGNPVQVHALEHYCESVKKWTCAAALIHDDHGRDILGTIDISGSDDTFNVHSLALAISTASQIEAILKGNEARDLIRLLEWCNSNGGVLHTDGLIILDRKQRIISSNDKAASALLKLGVSQSIIAGQSLPTGQTSDRHRARAMVSPDNPVWMEPDWIQPVTIDAKIIGYTVVIPNQTSHILSKNVAYSRPTVAAESQRQSFDNIIGESEGIRAAIERAKRLALGTQPILVLGETGVGKEEFAKAIHEASPVHGGPFVALNCAALAKDLVASELFGYADGAFTGAARGGRRGKFEEADGGTLFLDEVGELPLDIQAHLLRVVQDSIITRVGENKTRKVMVRVVSATNRDLRHEISQGLFRDDLYYRLAATSLSIPPLRARQRDIPILVKYFLEDLEQKYGGGGKAISSDLDQALSAYSWPGNIRELRNVLESMWHLSNGYLLDMDDLPLEYKDKHLDVLLPSRPAGLRGKEREAIIAAIEEHGGNMRRVALALGIARSTLYEKMKAYGIRRGDITVTKDLY